MTDSTFVKAADLVNKYFPKEYDNLVGLVALYNYVYMYIHISICIYSQTRDYIYIYVYIHIHM